MSIPVQVECMYVDRPDKSFTQSGDQIHDPLLASLVLYQLS